MSVHQHSYLYDPAWINVLSADSPSVPAVHGAQAVIDTLTEHDFVGSRLLLGMSMTSTVVHDFISVLQSWTGSEFKLAGDSGMPFCGKVVRRRVPLGGLAVTCLCARAIQGFGAFKHHVPHNGDIVVVYGPTRLLHSTPVGPQIVAVASARELEHTVATGMGEDELDEQAVRGAAAVRAGHGLWIALSEPPCARPTPRLTPPPALASAWSFPSFERRRAPRACAWTPPWTSSC